jgi:hypothetical protein
VWHGARRLSPVEAAPAGAFHTPFTGCGPVPILDRVRLASRPLDQPHPDRFPPASPGYRAALAAHAEALAAGRPGYVDPATGRFVFSAAELAAKGTCCDTGCRHCPYLE